LEAEKRLEPDVVVMGTISRGGIPGLLVGNTAERLLGILDCSLVIVKPHDFVCPVTLE
jgi:universal stress protein E